MNTAELKKLAEAATPGPWKASFTKLSEVKAENGALIAKCERLDSLTRLEANARYVAAANPTAILKLLAINAELVDALKGVIENRDKNSFSREVYVTAEESALGPYWSPNATMVDSHAISKARAALAKAEGGEL